MMEIRPTDVLSTVRGLEELVATHRWLHLHLQGLLLSPDKPLTREQIAAFQVTVNKHAGALRALGVVD
jgi:hypothetical protein